MAKKKSTPQGYPTTCNGISSSSGTIVSGTTNTIITTNNPYGSISLNGMTTIPYTISTPFIGYSQVVNKTSYHFMSEVIEVDGIKSLDIAMLLASIESMGWKYYESLRRNDVNFYGGVGEHLERMYKQHLRDRKIDDILETKS